MKNIILTSLLLIPFSVFSQEEVSDELLNEFDADVSELLLDAPTGDETFSKPPPEEVVESSDSLLPDVETVSLEPEAAPETQVVEAEPVAPEPKPVQAERIVETQAPIENTSQAPLAYSPETRFNSRTGHWIATVGFETTQYRLPFDFAGAKKTFKEEDRRLSGGRLGFGREAYLGSGFLLGARLEGYYMGTLFNSIETASPEFEDVNVASTKDSGQILGGDGIIHLGWMFDYKTRNPFLGDMTYLALELFVEAGIGMGQAINEKNYFFKATTNEEYNVMFIDDFSTQTVSAGFNILSLNSGSFLYVKASQVSQSISERRIRGSRGAIASPTKIDELVSNPDSDPLTILAIGGGFKF